MYPVNIILLIYINININIFSELLFVIKVKNILKIIKDYDIMYIDEIKLIK